MIYVVTISLAVFFLELLLPSLSISAKLALIPSLVLKGEIWRLITYIFIPPQSSIFLILFVLYLYFIIGNSLEYEWGSFKLNIYYLIGMIGSIFIAMLTGYSDATYLNLSLFLAFAYLFPNHEVRLFFIFPIRVKYLAYLYWIFIMLTMVFGSLSSQVAALVSVSNYFLFFGFEILKNIKTRRNVYFNRRKFYRQIKEGQRANKENMRKLR